MSATAAAVTSMKAVPPRLRASATIPATAAMFTAPIQIVSEMGCPIRAGSASSQYSIGPRLYVGWLTRWYEAEYWPSSGVCEVKTS